MGLLIDQISEEINVRLQDILPALVAEVVRKHMHAQQAEGEARLDAQTDTQADGAADTNTD